MDDNIRPNTLGALNTYQTPNHAKRIVERSLGLFQNQLARATKEYGNGLARGLQPGDLKRR